MGMSINTEKVETRASKLKREIAASIEAFEFAIKSGNPDHNAEKKKLTESLEDTLEGTHEENGDDKF